MTACPYKVQPFNSKHTIHAGAQDSILFTCRNKSPDTMRRKEPLQLFYRTKFSPRDYEKVFIFYYLNRNSLVSLGAYICAASSPAFFTLASLHRDSKLFNGE